MFYRIPFIHFVTVSPCILYFKSKSIMKTGRNKGGGREEKGGGREGHCFRGQRELLSGPL